MTLGNRADRLWQKENGIIVLKFGVSSNLTFSSSKFSFSLIVLPVHLDFFLLLRQGGAKVVSVVADG
jgi:hypothetical protein